MDTCPLTGKPCSKPKSIHVTDLNDDGSVNVINLCQECGMSLMDITSPAKAAPIAKAAPVQAPLVPNAADALFGLLEQIFGAAVAKQMADPPPSVIPVSATPACPGCGCTLADIATTARLGCDQCYVHFEKELEIVLLNTHGSIKHVGKVPKEWKKRYDAEQKEAIAKQAAEIIQTPIEDRIKRLEEKLAALVQKEKYEDAAIVRDAINKIKATSNTPGGTTTGSSPSNTE